MTRRGLPAFALAALLITGFDAGNRNLRADPALPSVVDFNRDIRPILSDNCYQCHGPDKNKRKAQLRLDTKEGLFGAPKGTPTIVPQKADASELVRRLTTTDKNERMPDPKSGKSLSTHQIALIKKWIDQGAEWKAHWSFLQPARTPPPGRAEANFTHNAIDHFILAKLQEVNLPHSPQADRITLIRRLYFDLLGLPPNKAEVDAFVNDAAANAYEKVVDRLLSSEHYAERMAMMWLDLVRYADSIGYHSDNPMPVSPYRDYVIQAFNSNKPFDQFTREQLAGDLLPNATLEQKIASAYNRLLMTTEEGGAQPKEYEAKYAADRVRNVSSVWLGATMGCCQCHDHKFDPFTTKDFYSLAAFFADVKEASVGRREPGLQIPTEQQTKELQAIDDQVASVQKVLATATPELEASQVKWEEALLVRDVRKLPRNVIDILVLEPAKRSGQQKLDLAAHYRTVAPELQKVRMQLADLQKKKTDFSATIPSTLVTVSTTPRVVRILPRGNWLDETGEIVSPAVPKFLIQPVTSNQRPSRLDLANWLVARDNPLTARAFVNRLWKLYFGQGLCKSLDDLGSQGDWPTHPELLDWLAVEFMDSGWNVKHLVKLMVMSGTYRQSSKVRDDIKERDPYNRWLARQARFRLDAEMVRDNALAISGLLSTKVGGPSVKPYQPAGYWYALNFPTREWQNDKGEKLYRRGMYTHWQRTFLHPSMLAFDASTREECTVERPRSNIPQQALALLNDPTYVEAARAFAERILREGGSSLDDRLQWALATAVSRKPNEEELKLLAALYVKHSGQYREDKELAQKLLTNGDRPAPKDLDISELAAWTSVARVILNLHETITRN